MQLIVNGSKTHVLEVAPEANVAQLRAQLSLLEGVDCEQVKNIIEKKISRRLVSYIIYQSLILLFKLIFIHVQLNLFCSGSPLEDEVNVSVLENLTVELTVPLLGGKVHGSLARAGKVRGQTPKVTMILTILILMILPCICESR